MEENLEMAVGRVQLLSQCILGCVFSCNTARVKGKAKCIPQKAPVISIRFPTPGVIAHGIKSWNRIILEVKNLHMVVNLNAAYRSQDTCAAHHGIIRGICAKARDTCGATLRVCGVNAPMNTPAPSVEANRGIDMEIQTLADMIRGLPPKLQEKAISTLKELVKPPSLRSPKGHFTCFNCGTERSPWYWGKTLLGKRIYKFCAPYVDEDTVRYMIAFDRGRR